MSNEATGNARYVSLIYINVELYRGFRRLGDGYRGSGSPNKITSLVVTVICSSFLIRGAGIALGT